MRKQILTCPSGHRWEHSGPEPTPADLSRLCPVCTASVEHTIQHSPPPELPAAPRAEGILVALQPGQILAGFEILEEVNRGGMGVIYKARQQGLNRLVALKVIAPELLDHPDAMRRFRREVQAAALLSHPNIVTVYHTDLDGPWPYLAMEYVAGIDLYRLVKRAGPLLPVDACYYIRQAALGLQHAFEQGLVHRDIKPANLMVTPSPLERAPPTATTRLPRVKILDMGLARLAAPTDPSDQGTSLTQAGELLGTPDFMAPEQAEDARRADTRSDLYSLGGSLYFLLSGDVPFPGANLVQKLRRQLTEPPPSVAARRPDVRPELDALVKRLLAREPADRFQTPAELVTALDVILRDSEPAARPPSAPAPRQPTSPSSTPTPSQARQFQAHAGGVLALCASADGHLLLSGGLDETIRLWDTESLRELRCLADNVGPLHDVGLAPNGKWAASCSLRLMRQDMVVQLWDLASGQERRRLRGHTDGVLCVAVAPDGRRVAAGGEDSSIRIWAVDQPAAPPLCLTGHTDKVSSLTFWPAGDSLLSGGHDGMVRLWDGKTGAAKGSLNGQVGKVFAVAFGETGRRMAIAGATLRIRQANGSLTALDGHHGPVLCVAFSPDGQTLLSGGSDGTVRLWRAADGVLLSCLEGHTDKVNDVVFGAGGRVAFSGSKDGTIRRWPLRV